MPSCKSTLIDFDSTELLDSNGRTQDLRTSGNLGKFEIDRNADVVGPQEEILP